MDQPRLWNSPFLESVLLSLMQRAIFDATPTKRANRPAPMA